MTLLGRPDKQPNYFLQVSVESELPQTILGTITTIFCPI